jgi:hypothetical protein
MAAIYTALFEHEGKVVAVAALRRPPESVVLLPAPWQDVLIRAAGGGFALRMTCSRGEKEVLLLLNASSQHVAEQRVSALLNSLPPSEGPLHIATKEEFERIVEDLPPLQFWLNHQGYRHGGISLATDFRLFPLIDQLAPLPVMADTRVFYQCNCSPLPPDRERERSTRKLISALRLDSPFPPAICDLQSMLANRLLKPGFFCDEFLGIWRPDSAPDLVAAVERYFAGTMGRFGFHDSPLEEGSFADMLLTGLSSVQFMAQPELMAMAAATFGVEELHRMLDLRLKAAMQPPAAMSGGGGPPVFISYSSNDFAHAWAVCQYLESEATACWIAPRNISPGESYPDAIMRGVEGARIIVVVLSGASNLSPHVLREIEAGLKQRAVIIPLRVEPIEPTGGMRYLLGTCQWLDAFPRWEESLALLLRRVRDELSHPLTI